MAMTLKAIAQTKTRWLAMMAMLRDAHVPCERRIRRASDTPKSSRISVTTAVAKMKLNHGYGKAGLQTLGDSLADAPLTTERSDRERVSHSRNYGHRGLRKVRAPGVRSVAYA